MQVILIKDVENLGYANDIVEVRPGYANNYLIPQGYAKSATASARKVLAENLKQQAHKEAKLIAGSQAGRDRVDHHRQSRGRTHFRFGNRSERGRGPERKRDRRRPQEHQRRPREDDRRLRSRREALQRHQRNR